LHTDLSLVTTIAVSLAFAFAGGFLAVSLRLPPLIGYLLAGIAVGPFTPGVVADREVAPQLAEIGVILLMFGVGMHFSITDLLSVRRVALPGAMAQILAAIVMGVAAAASWGWSVPAGIVFGLALSVASTVVLIRALETRNQLETENGRIAVGWLIVEDLFTVLAVVLLPALVEASRPSGSLAEGQRGMWVDLGVALGKVAVFVAFMLIVGRRIFPRLLSRVEKTRSRELFTLAIVALAVGIALGSAELFGASLALGAFVAGMVVNESDLSHRAAKDLLPLQDAFAALFFVAVGMLFDPAILVERPLQVLVVVAIVVLGKSAAAFGIVLLLRRDRRTAALIAASLSQIGEFSFILAAQGIALGALPPEGMGLIVAGALISITLNPLMFAGVDRWLAGGVSAKQAA
jgi:monovalent cation:H+ antiporter-2, CPA2 family